jgi:nitric oxide reductase NorD protein
MSEPEDLLLDGAHVATRIARDTWRRYGPAASQQHASLSSVRGRLELFATALFGTPVHITPAEPAAPVTWLSRLARRGAQTRGPLYPGTDGRGIVLPPVLPLQREEDSLRLYQLLAVEQTARLARGTPAIGMGLDDSELRDWFLLAEGAIVDAWIAIHVPGLTSGLVAARAEALAARPSDRLQSARERALEGRLRAVLASDPATPVLDLPFDAAPNVSLAWARSHASRGAGPYRGLSVIWHWGRILEAAVPVRAAERSGNTDEPQGAGRPRVSEMRRRPRPRQAAEDEDDDRPGTWMIRADEPQESVEDPCGLQRPADRDDHADPEGLGDSLSDLPEARVVRTPGMAREVLRSGEELQRSGSAPPALPAPRGIAYPEWDFRVCQYRRPGAIVRELETPLGDPAWVAAAVSRQRKLARRVRLRFERLRPRHVRLGRQPDGSELDIDACVTSAADLRHGGSADGRLYVDLRPARRELTVALLVDVSASTDSWVSGDRRIVDVEKEALLVVCEALDALGDPYGIFAFSGEGADAVSVISVKAFEERNGTAVRRRIAALESDRYTRIGAALRHVTAAICRQPARRRLLLVLSDGKPNDVDVYESRYGVEDARQAVAEARRQGVNVFCLTVDREAPRYAGHLFGPAGFAVLRRTDQLPVVLIEALRQLIRS